MKPDEVDVERLLRAAAAKITLSTQETLRSFQDAAVRLRALADGAGTTSFDRPVSITDLAEAIANVKRAVAENDFSGLRRREARLAIRKFDGLTVGEGTQLLSALPWLWPTWVRSFFAERVDLRPEVESAWAALLARAPREIRLLDGEALNREALLTPRAVLSAIALGQRIPPKVPLRQALETLTEPGLLDSRWKYTALALATCAAQYDRNMSETWEAVSSTPQLEAMLLPPRPRAGASWFGSKNGPRPTFESSLDAHVIFAVALIRNELAGRSAAAAESWRTIYFESSFRDPREFVDARQHPESAGWQRVRALAPDDYNAFIDSLLREDISLFFSAVKMDAARKTFWQDYVPAASSSVFFLSHATRERLTTQFAGADDGVRAALRRARHLTDAGGLDAFALRFGRHVAVEFSQTGNAAYLYDGATFDRLIQERGLRASDLKRKDLGGQQLIHSQGWEATFERELARRGIQRAGRPRRGAR